MSSNRNLILVAPDVGGLGGPVAAEEPLGHELAGPDADGGDPPVLDPEMLAFQPRRHAEAGIISLLDRECWFSAG